MATALKIVRIQKNLRQVDVEKRTNIPQPRYSRIERGVTKATQEELERLIKCFGIIVEDD